MSARIVIDARSLRDGSTGRYVERLLRHLQQTDYHNDYTVLLKPQDFASWQPDKSNFEKLACPYKEYTFAEQLGFLKQLHALKPDLVHFIMTQQPVLYRGKTVTTIHDLTTVRFHNPAKNWLVYKFKQLVYSWVIKLVAHKSDQIIVPSQYVKYDLQHFTPVDPAKVQVVYEAADVISDQAEPLAKLKGQPFLLYVGRALPHKNLRRLVDAFAGLQSDHPNLKLVLAGKLNANYQQLQAYVETKSLKGVVFTDYVSEGQLRWLYEHASVYVFPSLSEGFGLPPLEAMQYGLPVAASQYSCIPEICRGGALYFDPLDVENMAEQIGKILGNKALAEQLAKNGRKVVKQCSWIKAAKETSAIYETVLKLS